MRNELAQRLGLMLVVVAVVAHRDTKTPHVNPDIERLSSIVREVCDAGGGVFVVQTDKRKEPLLIHIERTDVTDEQKGPFDDAIYRTDPNTGIAVVAATSRQGTYLLDYSPDGGETFRPITTADLTTREYTELFKFPENSCVFNVGISP